MSLTKVNNSNNYIKTEDSLHIPENITFPAMLFGILKVVI